ncbi:MAG TPA: GatB/YqeY domain-containing protein [Candidatus Saccharimonadales bacterium]
MLKDRLDQDLKKALLAGDKVLATTLRGLKSVILYAEVAKGVRDSGLPDDEIIALFGKEAKKRQESADLYKQGGNAERAEAELAEKKVIEGYLPQQLSDDELGKAVDDAMAELGASGPQAMGQVIGAVKQKVGASADGSRIAQMVKERLQ